MSRKEAWRMDNQKNAQKNKISELIESSLDSIRELVDANTIIGEPIVTGSGTTIIPVSKVSVGFAGGGNDYAGKNSVAAGKNNFGGGGGTGVSVTPVGFLVVGADGGVELLNMKNPTGTSDLGASIENIVDKAPDIIAKIKAMFDNRKKKKEEKKAEEEAAEKKAEATEEVGEAPVSDENA